MRAKILLILLLILIIISNISCYKFPYIDEYYKFDNSPIMNDICLLNKKALPSLKEFQKE